MSRKHVREVTILVHGIHSRGDGFDPLIEELHEDPAFPFKYHRVKAYDYGYQHGWENWFHTHRKNMRDALGGYLHKTYRKYPFLDRFNVIAHSYGTWALCHYLMNTDYEDVSLDLVALVGSVCEKDYEWIHVMRRREMVENVYNIMGETDRVVVGAPLVNMGWSGEYYWHTLFGKEPGFENTEGIPVQNESVPGDHGWYKTEDGIEHLRALLMQECKWIGSRSRLRGRDRVRRDNQPTTP